jgi:hypothetical protein
MKKIFFFFLLTTLISCEDIQYDGETRLVFKTKILLANGNPLPNSYVDITVASGYASDLISTGKTNENGEITLIFPAPENDYNINLKIYNEDVSYLEREITNIKKDDFVNYKFDFQSIYLLKNEELAPLNLTFNQVNINTTIKKVNVQGIYHLSSEYYNYPIEEYYEIPSSFLIKKNQAFQLKYTVINTQTGAETQNIVDLQIANDPLNYTINY